MYKRYDYAKMNMDNILYEIRQKEYARKKEAEKNKKRITSLEQFVRRFRENEAQAEKQRADYSGN